MAVSAHSDETRVGMARYAVLAEFSGGTLCGPGATNPLLGKAPVPRLHGAGPPQLGVPTLRVKYLTT